MMEASDIIAICAVVISVIALFITGISVFYIKKQTNISSKQLNIIEQQSFKTKLVLEWTIFSPNTREAAQYTISNIGENVAHNIFMEFLDNQEIPIIDIGLIQPKESKTDNILFSHTKITDAVRNYNGRIKFRWNDLSNDEDTMIRHIETIR